MPAKSFTRNGLAPAFWPHPHPHPLDFQVASRLLSSPEWPPDEARGARREIWARPVAAKPTTIGRVHFIIPYPRWRSTSIVGYKVQAGPLGRNEFQFDFDASAECSLPEVAGQVSLPSLELARV